MVDLTYFKMSFFEEKNPWSTSLSWCLKDVSVLQQHVKQQALDWALGNWRNLLQQTLPVPSSIIIWKIDGHLWINMTKHRRCLLGVLQGARAQGMLLGRSFPVLVFAPLLKCPDKNKEWEWLVSAWRRHSEMVYISPLLPEAPKGELPPHLEESLLRHVFAHREL